MPDKKIKIILIALLVVSLGLLIYQIKTFYDLKQDFRDKNDRLEELKGVKKNIKKIEEDLARERLVEEGIFARVPEGKEASHCR